MIAHVAYLSISLIAIGLALVGTIDVAISRLSTALAKARGEG